MLNSSFFQKGFFRLRDKLNFQPVLRKIWWSFQGARFGRGTKVSHVTMTWPHQVQIGENCSLEDDLFFKFDGIWREGPSIIIGDRVFLGRGCEFNIRLRINIGDDCLVASGCKFIDHDHGIHLGQTMRVQEGPEAEIVLETDVWLGVNVVLLKGIRIGSGAVVAGGAVVTKSIPSNEIWAGIPAHKIGERK